MIWLFPRIRGEDNEDDVASYSLTSRKVLTGAEVRVEQRVVNLTHGVEVGVPRETERHQFVSWIPTHTGWSLKHKWPFPKPKHMVSVSRRNQSMVSLFSDMFNLSDTEVTVAWCVSPCLRTFRVWWGSTPG